MILPAVLLFFAILFSLGWATQLTMFIIIAGLRQQAAKLGGGCAFMASIFWAAFFWSVTL
jgi:hypothetical protein